MEGIWRWRANRGGVWKEWSHGYGGDGLRWVAAERAGRRVGMPGADGASATALQPPPHLLTTLPAPAGGGRCGCHGTAGRGRRRRRRHPRTSARVPPRPSTRPARRGEPDG